MPSVQDTINKEEWKKWGKNTVLFSLPAVIAFLVALQGGANWEVAFGMFYQAILASAIDLFSKYRQGVPPEFDIPRLQIPLEPTPHSSEGDTTTQTISALQEASEGS